ncbi:MAG: Hsp20/alpha crystallin family protein [Patescibacteria group bacterium]
MTLPWFEHLTDLEKFYGEDFFRHQKIKPDQLANLDQEFLSPSLIKEAGLVEEASLNVDIYHDENNLYILCPLAGAIENSLDLTIDNDILTIKGRRQNEFEKIQHSFIYKECFWGNFSRSIVLPVPIIGDKITATLKNGVLKIVLPKSEEAKKVQIKIKYEE